MRFMNAGWSQNKGFPIVIFALCVDESGALATLMSNIMCGCVLV